MSVIHWICYISTAVISLKNFSGGVPEVVVPSYACKCIYFLGNPVFLSFVNVQSYDVCKSSNTLIPVGHIRLFAYGTTSLWHIWNY